MIFEDYAKGVLSESVIRGAMDLLNAAEVPIAVDPKHSLAPYRGATLVKPNLRETELLSGVRIRSPEDLARAVAALREELGEADFVVTRGSSGMTVFEGDGELIRQIIERKSGRRSSGIALSGVKAVVDPDAERGFRVLELTLEDGTPVEPDKIYRLVTSDFLMEGTSGLDFLAEIPPDQVNYTGILLREALIRYFHIGKCIVGILSLR